MSTSPHYMLTEKELTNLVLVAAAAGAGTPEQLRPDYLAGLSNDEIRAAADLFDRLHV